ncbi:MAG: serine hydrolase [Bacteroidia bacterium]|nr:serine hydrolase [Bacteroidia bacterium]
MKNLLLEKPEQFGNIVKFADKYRLQIIYSQVNRDNNNAVSVKHYTFRNKPDEYFYPASIVKLPLSLMTLEKINTLNIAGMDRNTRLSIDSSYNCQARVLYDYSNPDSFPTMANYIRKAVIVSDNDAYNRLYEFLGQQYLNERLFELGYNNARIVHRFMVCDSIDNKFTNAFNFYDKSGNIIYRQPSQYNKKYLSSPLKNMKLGIKYKQGKEIINGPKDFSRKNCMPLEYVHDMLVKLVYPSLCTLPTGRQEPGKFFNISDNDREFLKKQLCLMPRETGIKEYIGNKWYWDTFLNFLYYGADRNAVVDTNIRICNIVGQSFGFTIDCAYFRDNAKGIEFFLSAVIYTNENGVINSDIYEYPTIALPFMKNLGRIIYETEIKRKNSGN